ncbi:MAG: MFS transporter [Betaproteobacteria bacterium]|nr:MAG: MFS transporter [Betaproteobacteria bacterium]
MSQPNQYELLKQRRFLPFFLTQFLGAFNDNVYKNALVILVAYHAASLSRLDANTLSNLAQALFILPFFLFSATAGQIADKLEKSLLIRLVKLAEIAIMALGAMGLYWRSLPLLMTGLFLMGLHSTVFGPVKYAYLPQHLEQEEIVGGNGLVEMGTFLAILVGTLLGGYLIAEGSATPVAATVVALAVLGYVTSRWVPRSPAAAPDLAINWNPFSETWRILQFMRGNRTVFLSVLGISWFWFLGALYLSQFPVYTKEVLSGKEEVVTVLLALFSVGVGIGSLLCERASGRRIELGLVPFGSIGLTLFGIDFYFASTGLPAHAAAGAADFLGEPAHWRILADLALIGIFGGFYIVPLYTLIQTRTEASHRSRVIAGNNVLNALFVVCAAVLAIVLLDLGSSIPQLFLAAALLNAGVAIYIYTLVPEFLMRFLIWLLVHTVYRLDKSGLEHIPESGPAVLICNHVSYVDALVIAAACPRPVRFVMDHQIFRIPVLSFIFRTGRAIPIAPAREDPDALARAHDQIAGALEEGDLICIFPEGKITYDGQLSPFRPGVKRIVDRTPVPVVPLALRGLWGSFFSRHEGPAMTKWSRIAKRIYSRISLVAAPPVAAREVTPELLHGIVLQLRGDRL